jgi:hypothetical protein
MYKEVAAFFLKYPDGFFKIREFLAKRLKMGYDIIKI